MKSDEEFEVEARYRELSWRHRFLLWFSPRSRLLVRELIKLQYRIERDLDHEEANEKVVSE